MRSTRWPRFNAVPCPFAGEIQKQEGEESCGAAEALTVPEDAGRPAVSSAAPPLSDRNQHVAFHHPAGPQPPSEEVRTAGRESIPPTAGQEAADLEEAPTAAEQRCEPGLSPSNLASQEEYTTTLQDHLPSTQPEVKASSVGGDRGVSEGGDTRSTVQT